MSIDRRMALQGGFALASLAAAAGTSVAAGNARKNAQPGADKLWTNLPAQPPMNAVADVYAVTALNISRLAATTTRCKLDIPYGDDPWQRVDVYMPPDAALKNLPVFINIHGGGWTHGHKEWMGLNAPPIVAFPAVYVSVGYRLAPKDPHPAQIEDCLKTLAWVHANIAQYGGSPDRLFIGGHSAGAHLASLATLRTDLYPRFGLPAGVIKGCFPYSGVYDFRDVTIYGESAANNPGQPFLPDAKAAADASPIMFTNGNRAPFFVVWAENDDLLIKAQSSTFVAALKSQPGRTVSHMFPRFDHFWIHIDQMRAESLWTQTLHAWMTGDPQTADAAGGPIKQR